MTSKIKAVVFDSDGTLMDSGATIFGAYAYVAQKFGYPAPSDAEITAQLAQSYPLYQILQTFFPDEPIDELLKANGEYFSSQFTKTPTFTGARELLEELKNRDLRLAIVTGGNDKVIDLFKHHKLEHYFSSMVYCDRVARSKPNPEGFLLAAEECAAQPNEIIMVGDSPNDIFAGKNAGAAYTIAITHGHASREVLTATNPDYIVDSLQELRVLFAQLVD